MRISLWNRKIGDDVFDFRFLSDGRADVIKMTGMQEEKVKTVGKPWNAIQTMVDAGWNVYEVN